MFKLIEAVKAFWKCLRCDHEYHFVDEDDMGDQLWQCSHCGSEYLLP